MFSTYSQVTLAQTVNLDQLIKLKSLNYNDFEKIVTQKGYQYLNSTNDDEATMYEFVHKGKDNQPDGYLIYTTVSEKKNVLVTYKMSQVSVYNALKAEAERVGFVIKKSGQIPEKNDLYIVYEKGSRALTFIAHIVMDDLGKKIVKYDLLIN
ncbi:hypothetical protein GCM10027085_21260 [Spirosoma aerophilum]